jgi:hypothetical protein
MNIDNGKSIDNFNDIPDFYKEIINCWVEFGGGQTKTPTNFREIRNQNIWGNKYIKFNNKSLYQPYSTPLSIIPYTVNLLILSGFPFQIKL